MRTLRARFGPAPETVAARIRAERHRLGFSLADCGRALGVNRHTYRQLEQSANPELSTLIALVTQLGYDPQAIAPELFNQG